MKFPAMRGRKRVLAPAGIALAALCAVGLVSSTAVAAAAPGPVFRPGGSYDVGNDAVDVAAADLDGDGDNDLVTANENANNVSVLLNNGDGTFAPARNYPALLFSDKGPTDVLAADFNEDGALDLATANPVFGRQVSILIGNGDGTFAPPNVTQVGTGVAVGLTAGDFDGDGHVDLVVPLAFDSQLLTLLGNGDGTFHPPEEALESYVVEFLDARPAEVMSADFDGDGIRDVAVLGEGRGGDTLLPLLGDGDGTFSPAFTVPYPSNPDWYQAGSYTLDLCYAPDFNRFSRDFNGDGVPDLAVVNSCSGGKTIIFVGNGDGTFTRGESYPSQAEPTSLAVADFDGDGTSDLAVTKDARSGKASVMAGAGDGTFKPLTRPPFYRIGQNPIGVVAADLNGDGRPDLATANADSDSVTVLLNTAGQQAGQG